MDWASRCDCVNLLHIMSAHLSMVGAAELAGEEGEQKLEGKKLGPQQFRGFSANQSSELNVPIFLGKTARAQKKEGFTRTAPNCYGPSSSLSRERIENKQGRKKGKDQAR